MRTLKKIQITSLSLCLIVGTSLSAFAKTAPAHHKQAPAVVRAECYRLDEDGQKVTNVQDNPNDLMQIASVSKIFTTYWVLNEMRPQSRLKTKFYILIHDDKKTADVHIAGGFDPYFNMGSLQFVVSELNKMGVTEIDQLSYDKNFKFFANPLDVHIAERHFEYDDEPKESEVTAHLTAAFKHISLGYAKLVQDAAKLEHKLILPKSISMRVNYKNIFEFDKADPQSLKTEKLLVYQSLPVIQLLKEMNRNSNNFAADQFFLKLGGKDEFKSFIEEKLKLKSDQVRFYNGSGDCVGPDSKCGDVKDYHNRTYNEATCQAVLQVLHGLRSTLLHSEGGPFKLEDALAVVGKDDHATVNIYENDITTGTVTAKTGTIDPSVALAGMASTKEGKILFASFVGPTVTHPEKAQGHEKIEADLLKLIKNHGGAQPLDEKYGDPKFKAVPFFALDQHSKLEAESSEHRLP